MKGEHMNTLRVHTRSSYRKGAVAGAAAMIFFALIAASCPPDRAALNTLKDLRATAEHAVAVVKAAQLQTPPVFTADQEAKAKDLYSKYLAADKAVSEAIYAGTNFSTEAVTTAVADLVAFVNSVTKKGTP